MCKNHEICDAVMVDEKNGILKYTQYLKSIRVPFVIYFLNLRIRIY